MFYVINFIGGLIAFASPCSLPLLPGYLAYISGLSIMELKSQFTGVDRKKIFLHSVFFVLGFSLIFVLLGASATVLGGFLFRNQIIFQKIGGIIIIFFGASFLGVLNFKFLKFSKKNFFVKPASGYFGAFLFGVTFGFSWTPCIGPILASLLMLAANQESVVKGAIGLFVFSLGFGLPFILVSLFINWIFNNLKNINLMIKWVNIIAGIFLLLTGFLIFFGWLNYLTGFFSEIFNFQGI